MKLLIICTGNSCRSQMAEGFLKFFDPTLKVYSAGIEPAIRVHPKAIQVMKELSIDISSFKPKKIDSFLGESFDYVITVCGGAQESCPAFIGEVKNRLFIGFEDPAEATGTEEEVLTVFLKVRDEIEEKFYEFYINQIKK